MDSAGTGFRSLRVLFIKLLLLPSGLPEGHEVVIFAFLVLPHLENEGVQVLSYPADRPVLLANPSAGRGSRDGKRLPAPLRTRCLF